MTWECLTFALVALAHLSQHPLRRAAAQLAQQRTLVVCWDRPAVQHQFADVTQQRQVMLGVRVGDVKLGERVLQRESPRQRVHQTGGQQERRQCAVDVTLAAVIERKEEVPHLWHQQHRERTDSDGHQAWYSQLEQRQRVVLKASESL